MNIWNNQTRRLAVNCTLGVSLLLLPALWLLGGVETDESTVSFNWNNVSWIGLILFSLYGAASFHYVSVRFARTKHINKLLLVLSGLGGIVAAVLTCELLLVISGVEPQIEGPSLIGVLFAGNMLGALLWMRMNAVSIQNIINESR